MRMAVTAAAISTYGTARSQAPTGPSGPQCAWRVDRISARTNPATTTAALRRTVTATPTPEGCTRGQPPSPGPGKNAGCEAIPSALVAVTYVQAAVLSLM